jgi:hypothetical protein
VLDGSLAQTGSPAFNALIGANPNIRISLSYNPNQTSTRPSGNVFNGRVLTQLRDPFSGELDNLDSNSGIVSLFVRGTNSLLEDVVSGVGFSFNGPELLEATTGGGRGEFFETPFFDVDLEGSFELTSNQSFHQVLGAPLADEIRDNVSLGGSLPQSYFPSSNYATFVDADGNMLTSEDGGFTLPIADLDKIDGGSAGFSYAGSPDFFGNESYVLSDGRQVEIYANEIELTAGYRLTSAFGTTSAASVIDQFIVDGNLPLEDVPGSFELPDANGSPRTEQPVLIGDESFTLDDMFIFEGVELSDRIVYDPPVAVGYEYELSDVGAGEGFADIMVPTIMGDDEFLISVFDPNSGEYLDPVLFLAGDTFDFTTFGFDVTRFSVLGIEPSIMLDPNSNTAFPALIGFVGNGTGTLSQTPLTVEFNGIPEPTSGLGFALAFGALAYRRRR